MYIANQIIAKEGEEANCIYIIKEGEVNCVKEGRIIRNYQMIYRLQIII